MPYIDRVNAKVFYDDVGAGEPIITTHGFIENGSYWGRTGVSSALATAGYRVIDMDMRGHGRSVAEGVDPEYTVTTVADDIGAVADGLGLKRFHLLTHATGGMAGLRFAMDHSDRLLSLISTDTSSATIPTDEYSAPRWDNQIFPTDAKIPGGAIMADSLAAFESFHNLIESLRQDTSSHMLAPFFTRFDTNPEPERCWRWLEDIYAINNFKTCVNFARSFFDDPNPQVPGLRRIRCPTLVLVGEHDTVLRKPCGLLARCVPQAEHLVLDGLGHMIAIEDPERVTTEILKFLRKLCADVDSTDAYR